MSLGCRVAPRSANLQSVHCIGEHIWAVGDNGLMLASRDGGATCHDQSTIGSDLRDVWFATADQGWCVGRDGVILGTTDGGTNWVRQDSGTETNLFGVHFTDDGRTGWAVGENGT